MQEFTNIDIIVPSFAIVELGLSGNDLLVYSLIHQFSQGDNEVFNASLSRIASLLNMTKRNVARVLDRLISTGLITRISLEGVNEFCYRVDKMSTESRQNVYRGWTKCLQGVDKMSTEGGQNVYPTDNQEKEEEKQEVNDNNNINLNQNKEKQEINLSKKENTIKEKTISLDKEKSVEIPAPKEEKKVPKKREAMVRPTKDDIQEYCRGTGITNIDIDYFLDYYNSKGWKVGTAPMKDWKATIRNWSRKEKQNQTSKSYDNRRSNKQVAYSEETYLQGF